MNPWDNDPTWLAYRKAIQEAGEEQRRPLVREANEYLRKTYTRQDAMDLGALPAAPQVGVQQGTLF